ncbi:MAG: endonuclease [Candidatus Marinimicrobia bacterium]|nr:endonuclease [Candidatus Neomarinimicrobiota bacterium]
MLLIRIGFAQIPSGYYDSASGLDDDALKSALNDIIDGHTEYPYTSSGTDVWDILKVSDRDPNNSDNVICVYTQYSIDADQEYNSGDGWSREHVWAKSHGDFGTETGAGTDLHNLKPEDVSVNSTRNNKDFDDGGTSVTDSSPPAGYDGSTDCLSTSTTWEPPDSVKGDVARIIFYMVTRYEGENGEVDLEMVDYADSAPAGEAYHGVQSTLYSWHVADPVDDFETNRNNIIHDYQDNRNPFIDHPEYANYIWGGESPSTNAEPTNHATSITAGRVITINWTDPSSGTLPDGYLIKMSSSSYASITNPSDGSVESASNTIKYVSYDVQSATMGPLTGNMTWYIKIFPYTNSGSNIDYKIDSPQQTSIELD